MVPSASRTGSNGSPFEVSCVPLEEVKHETLNEAHEAKHNCETRKGEPGLIPCIQYQHQYHAREALWNERFEAIEASSVSRSFVRFSPFIPSQASVRRSSSGMCASCVLRER